MKGYSTTLSCWGGETYPPAQNGFASCCCKQVKTIRATGGLHHCYPCSTAALQCHQFTAGLVTTLSITWSISTSILTYWWVRILGWRMAHRHYGCNMLQAITTACTLLQACCSHEQLLFMYLLCLTWPNGDKGISGRYGVQTFNSWHERFPNEKFKNVKVVVWRHCCHKPVQWNVCVCLILYTLHFDPILMKKTLDSCFIVCLPRQQGKSILCTVMH